MSTPHISAEKGDFAKTVLMPGDPLRAKFIADTFLKDVRQVTGVRGMLGFTGTYEGRPISVMGSGRFLWPVPNYKYCSRWYSSGHKGVDICAAAGTPIYATASGTVTKAGYERAGAGRGYGYSVIISHGSGYTSVYAHCLSLTVHAGQSVKQGQLIGYVGSTGRSSGNHCHFEIRLNGSYIPPQSIFPGKR